MSESTILFVGLDVHKISINIAVAEAPRDAEVRHIGSIKSDTVLMGKILSDREGKMFRAMQRKGECYRRFQVFPTDRSGCSYCLATGVCRN